MAVEGQLARFPAGLDDRRPHGQVRDEVAVHYVEMEDVRAAFDRGDLLGQAAEICREQRGSDANHCVAVGGGVAGCSMIPPSSCRLTTTVIGSCPLTGAPRSGNWRMMMPSAMPG